MRRFFLLFFKKILFDCFPEDTQPINFYREQAFLVDITLELSWESLKHLSQEFIIVFYKKMGNITRQCSNTTIYQKKKKKLSA